MGQLKNLISHLSRAEKNPGEEIETDQEVMPVDFTAALKQQKRTPSLMRPQSDEASKRARPVLPPAKLAHSEPKYSDKGEKS